MPRCLIQSAWSTILEIPSSSPARTSPSMIESGRSGQWCADRHGNRTMQRTRATHWYALLLFLLITHAAWSQDVFKGQGAPDYEDQFSGNCHTSNPPNIFAQL